MVNKTKVSVIIPVYNLEKYLPKCLDSLLNQTLKDIEIICVDDGSSDNSYNILSEYKRKDYRVSVISQKNAGAGAARNVGAKLATGKYISFLDGDDFFELDKLESEYRKAEETKSEIVVSLANKYYEDKKEYIKADWITKRKFIPPYEPFNYRQLTHSVFYTFTGWAWDKLFLRSFILENNLQFQEQRTSNDLFFTYSALIIAKRISLAPVILSHQRENIKSSLSKTREKSWYCFYDALIALKDKIVQLGLFEELERDFVNYALNFTKWNVCTLKEPQASILRSKLETGWLESLGIINRENDYYYNENEYKWLKENFEEDITNE